MVTGSDCLRLARPPLKADVIASYPCKKNNEGSRFADMCLRMNHIRTLDASTLRDPPRACRYTSMTCRHRPSAGRITYARLMRKTWPYWHACEKPPHRSGQDSRSRQIMAKRFPPIQRSRVKSGLACLPGASGLTLARRFGSWGPISRVGPSNQGTPKQTSQESRQDR